VTGSSTPDNGAGEPDAMAERPGLEAQRELDDALYYLATNCEPCAERHFEKARLLGTSENAIAAVRAKHAAADRTPLDRP
jgi:AhpD family alkylhydroperoxidase